MVLHLKVRKSRSPPGPHSPSLTSPSRSATDLIDPTNAGWSSPVARQAHNLKVVGSNPTPATNLAASPPINPGRGRRNFACRQTPRNCRPWLSSGSRDTENGHRLAKVLGRLGLRSPLPQLNGRAPRLVLSDRPPTCSAPEAASAHLGESRAPR